MMSSMFEAPNLFLHCQGFGQATHERVNFHQALLLDEQLEAIYQAARAWLASNEINN